MLPMLRNSESGDIRINMLKSMDHKEVVAIMVEEEDQPPFLAQVAVASLMQNYAMEYLRPPSTDPKRRAFVGLLGLIIVQLRLNSA